MGDGSWEYGDGDGERRGAFSIKNPKSKIQNTPTSHPTLIVLNFNRQHFIATFNGIDDIHIFGFTENSVYAI